MFATPQSLFRLLALAEAVSWSLLIGGLILRATMGWDLAVTIGGGIHGFVFLTYGTVAVLVAKNQRLGLLPTVVAIGSAVVPYATIPTEAWLRRSGRLRGPWRREATRDPRDHTWHDRLLRVVLHHPYRSTLWLILLVAAVFRILLWLGPPIDRG